MEGPLSGDTTAPDTTAHRWLVYRSNGRGGYRLAEQVGYRTAPGNRIPEVAALSDDSVLVEEAAFSTVTGNSEQIYAVTGLEHAPDVSRVPDLALAPARDILSKTLVADLVRCPTLGAPAREAQANPLLDNYEGMAITANGPFGVVGVSLISDDNFSATQYTRVLNLALRLPARH